MHYSKHQQHVFKSQDAVRNSNTSRQWQRQTAQQNDAATIQRAVRNRNALNETISRVTQRKIAQQNDAATTIQSAVRNHRNHNALNETIKSAKINETLNNTMENMKNQVATSPFKTLYEDTKHGK